MVDPEHDSLESDIEDSDDRLEPETSKHQKKSTTSKKHTIEDDNHVGLDFDSDAKSDILYDDNVFGLSCDTDFKSDVVNDDGGVVEPLDQARTQLRGGLKDCWVVKLVSGAWGKYLNSSNWLKHAQITLVNF